MKKLNAPALMNAERHRANATPISVCFFCLMLDTSPGLMSWKTPIRGRPEGWRRPVKSIHNPGRHSSKMKPAAAMLFLHGRQM